MRNLFLVCLVIAIVLILAIFFYGPLGTVHLAKVPTIKVEATVISLSLDPNKTCENKCPGNDYPEDSAVIMIDKIVSVQDDNPNTGWASIIGEGKETTVEFFYSAQPAKIRTVPAKINQTSSNTLFSKPIPKEDGYFIYTIESTLVNEGAEKTLAGLAVGTKFRGNLTFWSPYRISIHEYEIIQ